MTLTIPDLRVIAPAGTRRWPPLYPSVFPALIMLAIGSTALRRPALGWDEHATWSVATRTPAEIVRMAGEIDGVIAPYYLFMHYWIEIFGDRTAVMRLPSLLAVAVAVGIAGEWGRVLFGPVTGLTGALILVTVPQLSRYATEARVYGIALLAGVLTMWLFHRATARPAWRRWLGYGLSVTILGYAHLLGLLILMAHLTILGSRRRGGDRRLWRGPLVMAGAVALTAPLIRLGLAQRGAQLDWIPPVNAHDVLTAPGAVFGATVTAPAGLLYGAQLAGLFLIGLAFTARLPGPWSAQRPIVELAVLAVLPPALLLGASLAGASIWVPRYVLVVIVPVALLAALALREFRLRQIAALLLLVALTLETHQAVRRPASRDGMNFRTVASVVSAGLRPGDGVVYGRVGTWSLRAGLDYELRDRPRPADVLLVRPAARAGALDADECATLTCFDTARVWYVGARRGEDPMSDAAGPLGAKLDRDYRRTEVWLQPLGVVALFERR
ncbi:glycosyltransferase family 39 protein [Actinoplanes sp. CA-015351]|uniref:glycosyltransferase family 39 protein n=1 Tax=Actinoplanes sp. CA-015351 TaxID=3239897 RepID=UPI003D9686D8